MTQWGRVCSVCIRRMREREREYKRGEEEVEWEEEGEKRTGG